jgi:hypothetical protein
MCILVITSRRARQRRVIVGRSRRERHVMLALQALNLIQPIYLLSRLRAKERERRQPPLLYNNYALFLFFIIALCGWLVHVHIYNGGDVLLAIVLCSADTETTMQRHEIHFWLRNRSGSLSRIISRIKSHECSGLCCDATAVHSHSNTW